MKLQLKSVDILSEQSNVLSSFILKDAQTSADCPIRETALCCVFCVHVCESLHSSSEAEPSSMFSSADSSLGVRRINTLRYTCTDRHAHSHQVSLCSGR